MTSSGNFRRSLAAHEKDFSQGKANRVFLVNFTWVTLTKVSSAGINNDIMEMRPDRRTDIR